MPVCGCDDDHICIGIETVHFNQQYGELYDLKEDPGEYINLWDDPASQDLKRDLLLDFIHAEMAKAPLPMPRIAGA